MKRMTPGLAAWTVIAVFSVPGLVQAQILPCDNTCVSAVTGPRQGVHTQFDGSASAVLWPPNHKLHTIEISAVNEDGDACDVTITDARQDEALDGQGDGNTSPDAANCSNAGTTSRIDLRGERSGLGTGRYYHVPFTMEDPDCAMPAMEEALVLVPHDQGRSHLGLWIDEGPLAPSYSGATLSCPE